MKAFKYLVFFLILSFSNLAYSFEQCTYKFTLWGANKTFSSVSALCAEAKRVSGWTDLQCVVTGNTISGELTGGSVGDLGYKVCEQIQCEANTMPFSVKVPVDSGKMVCISGCQVSISKCVDVDFEAGMTCDGYYEGRDCGTPPPTTTPTTPPVTQDPTNPTDKTDEQKTFENIMHVIGDKLDSIKDAITGGNQNQDGGDTGGSNGGDTGGDVNVNVDMSETNAKIDETNSLIDELTKWLQGEDLGDDIFGDQEPPEKELTPQQLDTNIFSGRAQCPPDARLSFNLLGGKTFTKTFEFKDWCDNLEIFGSLILIASYLYGAYIIVSKS